MLWCVLAGVSLAAETLQVEETDVGLRVTHDGQELDALQLAVVLDDGDVHRAYWAAYTPVKRRAALGIVGGVGLMLGGGLSLALDAPVGLSTSLMAYGMVGGGLLMMGSIGYLRGTGLALQQVGAWYTAESLGPKVEAYNESAADAFVLEPGMVRPYSGTSASDLAKARGDTETLLLIRSSQVLALTSAVGLWGAATLCTYLALIGAANWSPGLAVVGGAGALVTGGGAIALHTLQGRLQDPDLWYGQGNGPVSQVRFSAGPTGVGVSGRF